MNWWNRIFQDWSANPANPRMRIVLASFRLAQMVNELPKPLRIAGIPYLVLYRIVVEWILGIELHWKLRVGPGLRLFHGHALVINPEAVIGANCLLRHCTTIGRKEAGASSPGGVPVLGDGVDVGPHVVILGPIRVGDGAIIGAGSVVLKDVPAKAVVAGNPARVIRERHEVEGSGRAEPARVTSGSMR